MLRKYYICPDLVHCTWWIEYGRVVWGLIELENAPVDLATGFALNEDLFAESKKLCPKCGKPLDLVERTVNPDDTFMIKGAPYSKPLHSDALGMQPDQVAEHRKQFPNIEVDAQNRPVFENMPQHDAYMEKCGIVKHKQKVKPKGEVIATLKTNS